MLLLAPIADARRNAPKAVTRMVRVTRHEGLHLRSCSAIASTVGRHQAQVTIQNGTQSANAESILDLLLLAATEGTELVLIATGTEAQEALDAVVGLFCSQPELARCH
jgi:phosphocarrier protein HPr